jgi:hypothetical protein
MNHRYVLATLLGVSLVAGSVPAAAADRVEASVTIDGKSLVLPHVRAFSTGMPYVLIYLAEKPLGGFRYGTGGNDETWSAGQFGTVLRFAPAVDPASAGAAVERYVIPEAEANEDDRVTLRAPTLGGWQEQLLSQKGIEIVELESSDGVIRGKLSWSGKGPVSAWRAEFSVPLEEGRL